MKNLRIISCILACLCAAVAVPIGIFFGWWCLAPIAGLGIFASVMIYAKKQTEKGAPPTRADFMNTDEENERINRDKKD